MPSNRRTRWRAALLVPVLLAGVIGCTGEESTAPAEPDPGPDYAELQERIPLVGTDASPLFWQVDTPDDAEIAEAVLVVQLFEALLTSLEIRAAPEEAELALLFEVADGSYARRLRAAARRSDGVPQQTGPRWFRIMHAEPGAGRADLSVVVCVDTGWYGHHPDGEFAPVEENVGYSMRAYDLRRERVEERQVWLVEIMRATLGEEKRFVDDCVDWVGHVWEE